MHDSSYPGMRSFVAERRGDVPNNPRLPIVILPAAIDPEGPGIEERLRRTGWGGTWRWTIFDYHHYHPNAHEVLVVARGRADVALGGPGGETMRLAAGDVLILPAGTGHRRLSASADFEVCGAYPPGQEGYGTLRGDDPCPEGMLDRIAATPLPRTDPIFGESGPLIDAWRIGA